MRFPIHVTKIIYSPMNWHGPRDHSDRVDLARSANRNTKRNGLSVVRLGCNVPAWRLIMYGNRGQWWHFDLFLRGFKQR